MTHATLPLSIGALASHFGVSPWMIRAAIRRGFLEEPPRLGIGRVFPVEHLPTVRAALQAAGYLKEEAIAATQ